MKKVLKIRNRKYLRVRKNILDIEGEGTYISSYGTFTQLSWRSKMVCGNFWLCTCAI